MPYTVVLHIQGSDPIMGEIDEMPAGNTTLLIIKNPRRLDGRDLSNIAENTEMVVWPVERLNFVEVLSGEDQEQIIGFVRE